MVVTLFCIVYFICLYGFTFCSSSLSRVFLIVISSLSVGVVIFYSTGFSWYFLLFILVYFGGVYILFVYVSMMLPNSGISNLSFSYISFLLVFFFFFFCFFFLDYSFFGVCLVEYSYYLCSDYESVVYVFYCMMLVFGMIMVNLMVSSVSEYSR
uniref:NADH dehydrogenase subunit 6 n=1 Tax=Schistosoma mekongi TaxID=38744 RepID=Q9B8U2_SCHME|nr:NADH dehydrogenase subunit 6 [Schistosoma mekongi]AAG12189.2 NADH dehydrogenase subunit 6 [Schistosoma mekongi]